MTLDSMDIAAVLASADEPGASWRGMPEGTRIGHIHLRVSNVERSEEFYRRNVGMDVTNRSIKGATFLSVGGYHHHLGLNSWGTAGAKTPNVDLIGLVDWRITHSDQGASEPESRRAGAAGLHHSSSASRGALSELTLADPDGIKLHIL
jgi:catechol 2,3-dioxygenase